MDLVYCPSVKGHQASNAQHVRQAWQFVFLMEYLGGWKLVTCVATIGSGAVATEGISTQRRRGALPLSEGQKVLYCVHAMFTNMVKHSKRKSRRFRKYLRGNVDETHDVATLAFRTVESTVFDETVNERTRISSLIAKYTLSDFTPTADVGPIEVGIAHSDYTAAEIQAVFTSTTSWNEGDKIGQEIGKRLVRSIGVFEVSGGSLVTDLHVLNDGKPIKTKLNWILNQGQTL